MLKFALQYDSVASFVREFPEKIATSGVYVKTDKPAETGDSIGILFKFKQSQETFTGVGEVVWIDTDEEGRSGKKGLVVRNIALDAESQKSFNSHMKSGLQMGEHAHEEAMVGGPVVNVSVQSPPMAHSPNPSQAHAPVGMPAQQTHVNIGAAPKKKWPVYAGAFLGVALFGFLLWYFALGGKLVIANMGIEYRDGRVTKVDSVNNSFSMGLLNQVSSDWQVITGEETQWIGVRGISELREGDRIGLRYKTDEGRYSAKQVTVKERVVAGTIGSLIDRTKGVFNLQDSKVAGSVVELSGELNDQVRAMAGKLKPGDVVESVYAVGVDGKNVVRQLIVQERTQQGVIAKVDPAAHTITIKSGTDPELNLTGSPETEFQGVADWAALAVSDTVKVGYKPEGVLAKRIEMVTKYVAPVVVVAPPAPKPVVKAAPRVMKDVLYNTDSVMARFAFVFNRKAEFGSPERAGGAFERVIVRVRGATSEYPKSELFLSAGPLRTVRFDDEGGDLVITFLANKGVSPRCSFEQEGDRIIALCFKN